MHKPYKEQKDQEYIIRTFDPSIDSEELIWHVDFEDREIEVINSGNWFYQEDNKTPRKLIDNEKFLINKMTWHRIIKGNKNLVIKIIKK